MEEKEQAQDRVSEAVELFARLSDEDQQKILDEIWELVEKLEAANESGKPEKAEEEPESAEDGCIAPSEPRRNRIWFYRPCPSAEGRGFYHFREVTKMVMDCKSRIWDNYSQDNPKGHRPQIYSLRRSFSHVDTMPYEPFRC